MNVYVQTTAALQQANATDTLRIGFSSGILAMIWVIGFVLLAVSAISIFYILLYLTSALAPFWAQASFLHAAMSAAFFAFPPMLLFLPEMLLPRQLVINAEGMELISYGKIRKKISWDVIADIALYTFSDSEGGSYRAVYVTDARHNRTRLPCFSLSPEMFARYLVSRKNKAGTGADISLRDLDWLATIHALGGGRANVSTFGVGGIVILLIGYIVGSAWLLHWALENWSIIGIHCSS
jgi:hypothetical protein